MKWDDIKDHPGASKGENHIAITLWPKADGDFGELTLEKNDKIVDSTVVSNYSEVEYALLWVFKNSKKYF